MNAKEIPQKTQPSLLHLLFPFDNIYGPMRIKTRASGVGKEKYDKALDERHNKTQENL